MVARQPAEAVPRHLAAGRVHHQRGDRQLALAGRHRRRQDKAAPAVCGKHRRGQDIALAHQVAEVGDRRVGREIDALDGDVCDALPAGLGHDLVARAHEIPPRPDLDLLRPGGVGQQACDRQLAGGERGDLAVEPGDALRAHQVKPHPAGRDWARVRILHPQNHVFVLCRCRQTGVVIGRPGVGVVGAGQNRAVGTEGVERIFQHVVPGGADHVNEKLSGEFAQAEALAHRAAVYGDAVRPGAQGLGPPGQHLAVAAEQHQPQRRRRRAVPGPVIGRGDPRMLAAGIAEEGEVGDEIERIEIMLPVGQEIVIEPHVVEADDFGAVRHQVADVAGPPPGVEGGDEDQPGRRCGQVGNRLGAAPQFGAADVGHRLHEDLRHVHARKVVERRKALDHAERIVDRDRSRPLEARHQGLGLCRGERMAHRLVERVAAGDVAEGFDVQGHEVRSGDIGLRRSHQGVQFLQPRRNPVSPLFAAHHR